MKTWLIYGENGIRKPGIILFIRIDIRPGWGSTWFGWLRNLMFWRKKAKILSSSLSDHNPILWQMNGGIYGFRKWRLTEDILDNSEIVEHLKKDIKNYFDLNLSPNMKLSKVWDTFKVVLRSRMIKWNIIEKTKRKERLHQLQEQQLKKKRGGEMEKQLKMIKHQINNLENQEMVWALKKTTAKISWGIE